MTQTPGFRIEVSSKYEEWWRYNVALMCGCFDVADNRTDFAAIENRIADIGSNLTQRPTDFSDNCKTVLKTPLCDHIVLYIYVVPHTLPVSNDIAGTQPFNIDIHLFYGEQELLAETRSINQWSGASIEMRQANHRITNH